MILAVTLEAQYAASYLGVLVILCTTFGALNGLWAEKSQRTEAPAKVTTDAFDYRRSSAPCHGLNANGDGPVAAALNKKPADLTQITKGHAGKFPEDLYFLRYLLHSLRSGRILFIRAHAMHSAWERLFPGFVWISCVRFSLSFVESYAVGLDFSR